jgi:LmbE family N-acetylglucosaminyl deacetylase
MQSSANDNHWSSYLAHDALVVVAHPDDESFGLGAIISQMTATGAAVHIFCYTHGEASTLNKNRADLDTEREAELRHASAQLAAASVTLLGYPDGGLAAIEPTALAAHAVELAVRHRPDGLLVFDDSGVTSHPDHQAATRAAVLAARAAGLPVLACALPTAIAERLRAETASRSPGSRPTASTCASGWTAPGNAGPPSPTPANSPPALCYGGGCSCRATASTCAGYRHHLLEHDRVVPVGRGCRQQRGCRGPTLLSR